jgi:hypothetical protein
VGLDVFLQEPASVILAVKTFAITIGGVIDPGYLPQSG